MTSVDRAQGHEQPFAEVFGGALRGEPCDVVGLHEEAVPLPVADWTREPDEEDLALLARCVGPTLDIGCGPGRMTGALAAAGTVALGIDLVPEAVAETVRRGGAALRRDVFGPLPGEGRWGTALLADGNVGIGGDPVVLLRRVRRLLAPTGRAVVEVAAPGVPLVTRWATLASGPARTRPFRWSVVGADDVVDLGRAAGFRTAHTHPLGRRWCCVLEEAGETR